MELLLGAFLKGNYMVRRAALIAGVIGQDGTFLADLLPGKGYMVHGIKRRASSFNTGRAALFYQDRQANDPHFMISRGDLTDVTERVDADIDVISRGTRPAVNHLPAEA